MKLASTLDAYLENRFQRNLSNGVLNLIAFVALLAVGGWHLLSGWFVFGGFLLVLGFLALLLGLWDIWIYRRNLRPIAKQQLPANSAVTYRLPEPTQPAPVTESTTRNLEIPDEDTQVHLTHT